MCIFIFWSYLLREFSIIVFRVVRNKRPRAVNSKTKWAPRTPKFNVDVSKLGGAIAHNRAFISHRQNTRDFTIPSTLNLGGKGGSAEVVLKNGRLFRTTRTGTKKKKWNEGYPIGWTNKKRKAQMRGDTSRTLHRHQLARQPPQHWNWGKGGGAARSNFIHATTQGLSATAGVEGGLNTFRQQ